MAMPPRSVRGSPAEVRGGSAEAKATAAKDLAALAYCSEEHRAAIATTGAIVPLVCPLAARRPAVLFLRQQ